MAMSDATLKNIASLLQNACAEADAQAKAIAAGQAAAAAGDTLESKPGEGEFRPIVLKH